MEEGYESCTFPTRICGPGERVQRAHFCVLCQRAQEQHISGQWEEAQMTRVAHLAETLASLEGVQLVQDRRQYNSAHRHTQEILNWIRQRTAKFHEGKTAPIFITIIARQGAKTVQRLPALWVTDANNCRCLVTVPAESRRHTADMFFKQTCYRTSLWGPKHTYEGEELVNELSEP